MDNSLSVWCFVFLLRCLIYKVHAACLAVTFSLPQRPALVKRKFSVSGSFFLTCQGHLATALIEYHSTRPMSSPFFPFRDFFFFPGISPGEDRETSRCLPRQNMVSEVYSTRFSGPAPGARRNFSREAFPCA